MKNNVAKMTEYGDLVVEVNHTKTNETSDLVKKSWPWHKNWWNWKKNT